MRMGKMLRSSFLVLLTCLFLARPAIADDPSIKLSRGVVNVVSSPVEIILSIGKVMEEKDPLTAAIAGSIHGVFRMLGRALSGVYDVVTFPVPIPANYDSLIEPETLLKLWNRE